MATGPTWQDRYMDDPEFARSVDRVTDEADEELAEYFKTPQGKVVFYGFVLPTAVLLFTVTSVTIPFHAISDRLRNKKSK